MTANQTARELWVAIANHFQANKAPRAIFLSHAFHALTQGDMSVQALKKAADALRDVDKPVADSEMVLALLAALILATAPLEKSSQARRA